MPGDDDKALFAAVVMPYLGDAYALARWMTGTRTDAEDVVQEASLRAFRAIRRYAGGNARAWVLTIVRNTALTWMAKSRPVGLVVVDDLGAVEGRQVQSGNMDDWNCVVDPETEIIAKADAARLETAISVAPFSVQRDAGVARPARSRLSGDFPGHGRSHRDGHVPPGAGPSAVG